MPAQPVAPTSSYGSADLTSAVRFFRHPVAGVVTVVLSMFAMILGSGLISAGFYLLVAWITGERAEGGLRTTLQIASYVTTTVIAVLLIMLWRRLAQLPMRGFGLVPLSRAWLLIPGFGLAVGVNYASAATAVAAGASTWGQPRFDTVLVITVITIFFGQAFPEELLWRGHLSNLLARRLRAVAVIATTSLAFGSMHIVSHSSAQSLGEQLLYVLQGTALGFLMIAMRYGTASLWMAVGFHTGYNAFFEAAAPVTGNYGVELLTRAVLLAVCATLVLFVRRFRRRADRDFGEAAS